MSHGHDGFESSPFRFHADVAVVLQHLFRDVPGDVHDRLIAGAALGEFGDEGVPVVVPAALHSCFLFDVFPASLQRGDRTSRIERPLLPDLRFRDPAWENVHSGLIPPNRPVYHSLWSFKVENSELFNGIVRPSPGFVLLLPTLRNFFSKTIWPQANSQISC